MVQKRQLAEEEYDVSPKHLKLENSCQLVSCLEFPLKDVLRKPFTSGIAEGCFSKQSSESDCQFESGKITNRPVCTEKDVGYSFPGCLSTSSWTSSTMSEDVKSEAPILIPEHNPLKPITLIQPEDTPYLLRFPLREVPVGPEYQADIPEWCGYGARNASLWYDSSETSTLCQTSEANSISSVYDENKFMGSCVIPMPEADPTICDDDAVGRGRTECCCEDLGSLRCVRQHIREARVNLRGNIGHERFSELGFSGMGDVVACKWTQEEEQLFHEVVYYNPVSLGKNFWDHLADAFPSRTNQEIVSYYFNVFVLQRRAEQNRCDPMNADSDDDEWQGSDPSEEVEDLGRDEIQKYSFSINNPVFDYTDNVGFLHGFRGSINFSETQPAMLFNSCSLDSSQPSEKTLVDESGGDCDFQDDSCTSSDIGVEPQASEVKVDSSKSWSNHDFIFEPSDSKVWDVGYFSFPRNKIDFLPTGSMIEEVFGVESWNIKVTDNNKGSS